MSLMKDDVNVAPVVKNRVHHARKSSYVRITTTAKRLCVRNALLENVWNARLGSVSIARSFVLSARSRVVQVVCPSSLVSLARFHIVGIAVRFVRGAA